MDSVLGRKQRIKNSDWIEIFDKIEQLITKKELDQLVDKTIQDIKAKTKGKKAAYAWSGGKDSLVLGEICRRAGISSCVLVISNLEYKAFTQWVEDNKPPELSIINTGQDIKWLVTHPHMLFPQDSKYAAQWFHIVQHRGQAKYYKENNLDMLLLGRRRADGNYVGKGDNIYTNSQGVTRYSPLSNWTHEQVLAYIHYYNLAMPPIYDWKNGYLCGTHPWPARQWTGSTENAWSEIYEIDSSIVIEAAEYFESAKAFLKTIKRVSQFFSIDTAKSLVKMNEYYPNLMERIVRREPNAYLAALYWDSEMFGRSTAARKQNEKGMAEKDYKAALLELFSDMNGNFQTKHKRYVAERYRNFFMSVSAIADNKDCKAIYEGLISGDPKLRSYRALYQRIYGKYITEAKKKEGMTNG